MSIKILHFFKTYLPDTTGGIEQVIFQIAEGCSERNVHAEVLSLSPRGAAHGEVIGNHQVHRSKLDFHVASTGFSLSAIKDFKALAAQADIIHYHFPWPFMDMLHFIGRIDKPSVLSYHSDIVRQSSLFKLYQPLMNRFLDSVDCIVASSPNYVATSPVLTRYKDKVKVVPYGLDEQTYPEPSDNKLSYWRERFGDRFFLFVGKLRYYKGLNYLLEAASLNFKYPVVLLGDGFIEDDLRKQAEELNVKNIHFLGSLGDEDKVALLKLCYAFVFPSHLRSESFGISLLESAMYGKPMISCEIGTGTTYINLADETGLVVPPGDPVALRQAMQKLIDEPELAKQLGESSRLRYCSEFSASDMVDSYVDIYQELMN